jgi:Holliday junction resolvase RusA-like endonuclease
MIGSDNLSVELKSTVINDVSICYIAFNQGETIVPYLLVSGEIVNSISTREKSLPYKRKVAKAIKSVTCKHSPANTYAISLSMKFCSRILWARKLDVDNFLKPLLDGIAAGLFCDTDADSIEHFSFDDSNFLKLYVERLSNTMHANEEGVIVTISKLSVIK